MCMRKVMYITEYPHLKPVHEPEGFTTHPLPVAATLAKAIIVFLKS